MKNFFAGSRYVSIFSKNFVRDADFGFLDFFFLLRCFYFGRTLGFVLEGDVGSEAILSVSDGDVPVFDGEAGTVGIL